MNTILQTLTQKREFVKGKIIIGIDPAKDKHQVRILDSNRIPIGKTFSFKNDYNGFNKVLCRKLDQHLAREVDCRKDKQVIDEIPGAYKDIDLVMENQNDLVEIVHTLKQVICVKG